MKISDSNIHDMLQETHLCIKNVILYLERINTITDRQIIDAERVYLYFHAAMTELRSAYHYWEELYPTEEFIAMTTEAQRDRISHFIDIVTLSARNNGVKESICLLNDFIKKRSSFDKLDIRCLTRNA